MTDENLAPARPVPGALFQYLLFVEDDPVLSTGEIADELPIGKRAALKRLRSLREEGYVQGKKVGSKVWVWWPPEDLKFEAVRIAVHKLEYESKDYEDVPSHSMSRYGAEWVRKKAINKRRDPNA